MNIDTIAHNYLSHLQEGRAPEIISLFSDDGIVVSPIYGTLPAAEFYPKLLEDTKKSEITFDGIFKEKDRQRIALLFDYRWTLKNDQTVDFKVVDILELDTHLKIKKLTIIYDTTISRTLVKSLRIDF